MTVGRLSAHLQFGAFCKAVDLRGQNTFQNQAVDPCGHNDTKYGISASTENTRWDI